MKTDDLIDLLAMDQTIPPRKSPLKRAIMAGVLGLGLGALLLISTLKLRADFGEAIMMVMMKAGFAAAFAAAALPMMIALWRPGRSIGAKALGLIALALIAAIAAGVALMGTDPSERMRVWMGGGFPWCLVFVPILAAPTAAILLWVAKSFAPARLTAAGAAIGAFSGGIGAMAYSMYCPIDTVPFVATWYSLAIGVCAALGALAGARLLRW